MVFTSVGLATALQNTTPTDLILADGVYDNPVPFPNPSGHRIYASNPGRAVLRAGISIGGNWGPGQGLVRGLAFDVSDPAKALHGGIINVWGTGKRTRILDSTFDGNGVVEAAVMAREPDGLVLQRISAHGFTGYGILVDAVDSARTLSSPALVEDIDISDVSRPVPRSSNGTAEACIWLGNTAVLRRARVRSCAWMGLWTGGVSRNSLYEHLDIDGTMVGVYLEHYTTGSTLQHMRVGPSVETGVSCEWADPAWGGKPASVENVIQDSTIASTKAGVYMDIGTTRTVVRRVRFSGQRWAAIGDHKGIGNAYYDNDYTGIAAGAVAVSQNHIP